jgi:hypothetical protein
MPARKPRSASDADSFWALADDYAALANDPTATPDQRRMASDLYARAVADATAADARNGQ